MRAFVACLTALSLAASLSAQKKSYLPNGYDTKEGSSYTAYPFGLAGAARVQYLYNASLAPAPVTVITSFGFRGNGGTANAAKNGVVVEIGMTTSQTAPVKASTTFTQNHGKDYKIVFTKKTFNLPAQPSTPTPSPFVTQFKLDVPFTYIAVQGNFLVDFIQHTGVSGGYSHDCEYSQAATNTTKFAGCGGVSQSVTGASATTTSATMTSTVSGGPASGVGVYLWGTMFPAAIPLPVGNCSFHVNPILLLPLPLSASGTANVQLPTPFPTRGVTFGQQWVTIDGSLQTWASSPAIETTIGGYLDCCRIYNTSSATNATGSVQFGVAVVFELTT